MLSLKSFATAVSDANFVAASRSCLPKALKSPRAASSGVEILSSDDIVLDGDTVACGVACGLGVVVVAVVVFVVVVDTLVLVFVVLAPLPQLTKARQAESKNASFRYFMQEAPSLNCAEIFKAVIKSSTSLIHTRLQPCAEMQASKILQPFQRFSRRVPFEVLARIALTT